MKHLYNDLRRCMYSTKAIAKLYEGQDTLTLHHSATEAVAFIMSNAKCPLETHVQADQ